MIAFLLPFVHVFLEAKQKFFNGTSLRRTLVLKTAILHIEETRRREISASNKTLLNKEIQYKSATQRKLNPRHVAGAKRELRYAFYDK